MSKAKTMLDEDIYLLESQGTWRYIILKSREKEGYYSKALRQSKDKFAAVVRAKGKEREDDVRRICD